MALHSAWSHYKKDLREETLVRETVTEDMRRDSRASTGRNRIRMYGMRTTLEVKLRTRAHRTSSHLRLACNAVQALLLRSVMTSVLFID